MSKEKAPVTAAIRDLRAHQVDAINESHLERDKAIKQIAIDGHAGHFIT